MFNRKNKGILLFILIILAFLGSMSWIFIRLSLKGLSYPPYSSFSSEPKGLRAIYECYHEFKGLPVIRSFKSFEKFKKDPNTFHIGAALRAQSLDYVPLDAFNSIDSTVKAGSSFLLTIDPASSWFSLSNTLNEYEKNTDDSTTVDTSSETKNIENSKTDSLSDSLKDSEEDYWEPQVESFKEKWEFEIEHEKLENDSVYLSVTPQYTKVIGDSILCKSPFYFRISDTLWQVLAKTDGKPVIIQRTLGKGTLTLSADSYFLTNEALAYHRNTKLLFYLIKKHPNIVFHEAHLGLIEQTGLTDLMNKYGITGIFIGVIILFLLYVWKSSMSIMTLDYSTDITNIEDKKVFSNLGGLSGMIQKHINKNEIIDTCISEWEKSSYSSLYNKSDKSKINTMNKIENSSKSQIESYNQIYSFLKHNKNSEKKDINIERKADK